MKKFVLALFIVVIVIGAVLYYFYTRISYTPDWYDEQEHRVTPDLIEQSKGTTQKIADELTTQKRTVIDKKELDAIVIEKIHQEFPESSENQFIKAFHSEIKPDNITMETVVDLERIPLSNVSPKYQKTIREFINTFPKTSRQNFYIQVSGKPVQKDNRIEFDQNATVRLGKMEYPLRSILNQISGSDQLEAFIPLDKLPFKSFRLEEGRIILEE